jgi:hypothetical protein
MKRLIYLFLIPLIVSSCTRNVEELPLVDCDPGPVVYEINWMMDVTVQEASVILRPGDTVRWIWAEDDMPHDVSSTDPNAPIDFGSAILTGIGNVYEYTFTEAMEFNYLCSVHPTTMFGTITVIACD